jgi:hypothetical protein
LLSHSSPGSIQHRALSLLERVSLFFSFLSPFYRPFPLLNCLTGFTRSRPRKKNKPS